MTTLTAEEQAKKNAELLKVPVVIEGDRRGGPFTIKGEGFGAEKGTLTVGGQAAKITSWTDGRVKGELPSKPSGDLVLTTPIGSRIVKWAK